MEQLEERRNQFPDVHQAVDVREDSKHDIALPSPTSTIITMLPASGSDTLRRAVSPRPHWNMAFPRSLEALQVEIRSSAALGAAIPPSIAGEAAATARGRVPRDEVSEGVDRVHAIVDATWELRTQRMGIEFAAGATVEAARDWLRAHVADDNPAVRGARHEG